MTQINNTSKTNWLSSLKLGLNYQPFKLPTIIIGKNNTNLIHGSCSRPASGLSDYPDSYRDAFESLDAWMSEKASSNLERPPSLILTGDQIYADDIDPTKFDTINKISKLVFGYYEYMDGNKELYIRRIFRPIQRGIDKIHAAWRYSSDQKYIEELIQSHKFSCRRKGMITINSQKEELDLTD